MAKEFNEKNFDTRVVERNIKKGVVSQKDYDVLLKQLPDEKDNFDLIPIEDENAENDTLSDEEIQAMPEMKPEDIENFDFLEKKKK
jgi:hypothetical protein